jgi:hypothetical protein
MTLAEIFADYEEFGVTFSGNLLNGGTGNIFYNGWLVNTLIDTTVGGVTSLLSSDQSGTINVWGIRDENGNLMNVTLLQPQERNIPRTSVTIPVDRVDR